MWTKITKPNSENWTTTNPAGKQQYDQSSLAYDDITTFYDGADPNAWTKPAKPTTNAWVPVVKPT